MAHRVDAAQQVELSVLQHLFLGMNAHIHLDLGVASAGTAARRGIDSIESDFHQVNDVRASLVPLVEEELGEIAHRFSTIQHISHGFDQKVFNFSMAHARGGLAVCPAAVERCPTRRNLKF